MGNQEQIKKFEQLKQEIKAPELKQIIQGKIDKLSNNKIVEK